MSLLRVKNSQLPGECQSPSERRLISGIVKSLLKGNHSLAVFTLEAKKHPFPADRARLRHPVLGGKPVRKKGEMSKVRQWPWAHLQEDVPLDLARGDDGKPINPGFWSCLFQNR